MATWFWLQPSTAAATYIQADVNQLTWYNWWWRFHKRTANVRMSYLDYEAKYNVTRDLCPVGYFLSEYASWSQSGSDEAGLMLSLAHSMEWGHWTWLGLPSMSLLFSITSSVAAVMQRDSLFPTGALFNQRAFSPSCVAMQRCTLLCSTGSANMKEK